MVETKKTAVLMNRPRILVISPAFELTGGVVEFNKMLLKYSTSSVRFFKLGSGLKNSKMGKISWLFLDYFRFIFILMTKEVDVVHLNPSLGKNAITRDGYFLRISKFFNKKVYVHWHGWNPHNEYLLTGKNLTFIKKTFFVADHIKFLSEHFADKFKEIGCTNRITIGNTFIDDELLSSKFGFTRKSKKVKILFLSTISKNKGIYLALDAFKKAEIVLGNIELIIAGDGPELSQAKEYVVKNKLINVIFVGHVKGLQKAQLYSECDIYLFPSYYEGMPTSLLEAMGFGLVLISSDAGAIPDFFVQEKMGTMITSYAIQDYVNAITEYIENQELRQRVKNYNIKFASKHFIASSNIAIIDQDYKMLMK